MKYLLSFTVYLLFLTNALSQRIEITVLNLNAGKAYLSSLSGEKVSPVDSVSPQGNGRFIFSLPAANSPRGLYRLSFDKNKRIDFVYDNEDVCIESDASNLFDSLKIVKSESNRFYYAFIRSNKLYKTKTELLQLVLARYPGDDPYYQTTQARMDRLQEEYKDSVKSSQKYPGSFIARYIRSAQLPVVDYTLSPDKQLVYLKSHALEHVDFNDDALINSDLFSNKSIEYLTYYRNPQLPKNLLEREFMTAVDTILGKAKVNTDVYKHVVEYLLDGFRKFGFDAIINYVIENYVIKDDICIDQKLETALSRRLDQAKYFKLGKIVPDIITLDSSGMAEDLGEIKSEKILILFYASWCPHCRSLLPQVSGLYKNQKVKKIEVFAVSIDTVKSEWAGYLRENGFKWHDVSDLKGWNGKAVLDYFIYATPTMFLIDKDKKIISKPLSIDDLKKWFES